MRNSTAISRKSVVVSQRGSLRNSSYSHHSGKGSISRIERREGRPITKTISLTKIVHPGRVKSITRMDNSQANLTVSTYIRKEPPQPNSRVRNILKSGRVKSQNISMRSSLMLNSNINHVVKVTRTQPSQIKGAVFKRLTSKSKQNMKNSLIQSRHKFDEGAANLNRETRVIDARKSTTSFDRPLVKSVVSCKDENGNIRVS